MNDQLLFEARVASLIAEYANQAPTAVDPVELTRLISPGRRSRALPLWPMVRMRPRRLVWVMVVAALALLMLGLFVGGSGFHKTPDPSPRPRYLGVFEPLPSLAAEFLAGALLPSGRVWILEAGGGVEYFDPVSDLFLPGGSGSGISGGISTELEPDLPDGFVPAGSGPQPVGLLDGRVLLTDVSQIGGPVGPGIFRLVLLNPSSGTSTATDWRRAWPGPTTTRLQDGRVLVIGDSVEILDPDTGRLSRIAALPERILSLGAIRLSDDRVLVLSRERPASTPKDQLQVFDPSTGTFGDVVLMPTSRQGGSTMTLLLDGRVLIAGGLGGSIDSESWSVVPRADMFDPTTGLLSTTPSMQQFWRSGHGATLLADGRVLIMGGIGLEGEMSGDTAEIFNPATGEFTPTARMTYRHASPIAITLKDGRVLILSIGDLGAETYR